MNHTFSKDLILFCHLSNLVFIIRCIYFLNGQKVIRYSVYDYHIVLHYIYPPLTQLYRLVAVELSRYTLDSIRDIVRLFLPSCFGFVYSNIIYLSQQECVKYWHDTYTLCGDIHVRLDTCHQTLHYSVRSFLISKVRSMSVLVGSRVSMPLS